MTEEEKKIAARARAKAWREANPERSKAAIEKCKAAKPEQYKAKRDAWFKANRPRLRVKGQKWRDANPERSREFSAEWRARNPEQRKAVMDKYRLSNQDKINAIYAKRRAAKKSAVPSWANSFFISECYHLARLRSKATGFPWHVDHIVPLQNKLVCGLHVEHNLQVIPGAVNQSKNNRHWPDMP